MHVTKPIDLTLLSRELASAGVELPGGLSYSPTDDAGGGEVYTLAPDGQAVELPAPAGPVVEAHDATPRAQAVEQQADTERLLLVNERAQADPAFAALAELALRGTQTGA